MAKAFDNKQAKHVIDKHKSLLLELSGVGASADRMRSEIVRSSNALVAQEVLKLLKDIPIEEINRNKRGIRVKTLREYGFNH